MIAGKLVWPALGLIIAGLGMAAVFTRPDRAVEVATNVVAHSVCDKAFVSGLDPHTAFAEITDRDGIRRLRWLLTVGEQALHEGNRTEAQRAVQTARPLLPRTGPLAEGFEKLGKAAQKE